jgi:hypothetical protein
MNAAMYMRSATYAQTSTINSNRQPTDWTYYWTTEDVVKHFANPPKLFLRLYNPVFVAEIWNNLMPEMQEKLDAGFVGYEIAIGRN